MKIRNGHLVLQAKDIPDADFYEAIRSVNEHRGGWAHTGDLVEAFPDAPIKVLIAKAAALIKRGLIDGCACGCRGDFEVIDRPPS